MPSAEKAVYGAHPNGLEVSKIVLKNDTGAVAELINYGATLTHLLVPDNFDSPVDVVLGFDDLKAYIDMKGYVGSMVGRVCNRIANGRFTLDGKEHSLAVNDGPNHLHGGIAGFSHKIWNYEIPDPSKSSVVFTVTSPDGDENYPGTVEARVEYHLLPGSYELRIDVSATTDKPTPINITNHSYFNLEGEGSEDVYDHKVQIFADMFCLSNDDNLVTGEIKPVVKTPFDFRQSANLGERIRESVRGGFDNNFCLERPGEFKQFAEVYAPKTGIFMTVSGTPPGLQFYTAQYMDQRGKGGKHYGKHSAFCMELQGYPDAVNQPKFPSVVIQPGEKYEQTICYAFAAK